MDREMDFASKEDSLENCAYCGKPPLTEIENSKEHGWSASSSLFKGYPYNGLVTDWLSDVCARENVKNMFSRLGFDNFTPHSLRKTAINKIIEKDGLLAGFRFARHGCITTTQRYIVEVDAIEQNPAKYICYR